MSRRHYPEDHEENVHEDVTDDFGHLETQGATGGEPRYHLPIYDVTTNIPVQQQTAISRNGSAQDTVRSTQPRNERPVNNSKPPWRKQNFAPPHQRKHIAHSYNEQPVNKVPSLPPPGSTLLNQQMPTTSSHRFNNRGTRTQRPDCFNVTEKTRGIHLSAPRAFNDQTRERFSNERAENKYVNNNSNAATGRKKNTNQQRFSPQHRDNDPKTYFNRKGKYSVNQSVALPTSKDVFNFMIMNMKGKGTLECLRKSEIFPTEIDLGQWFRNDRSGLFTVIEKNGDIACIFVYHKNASFCNYYCKKNRPCTGNDCKKFHICRNLCSGECFYDQKCKFSHNCFDEHNKQISDDLDFSNTFSSDEICVIIRLSFPHVCKTWSDKGTCKDQNCVDLHICPGFILSKCEKTNCPNNHDRNTDHNRAIQDAFKMTNIKDVDFKWRVFMVYNQTWARNYRTNEDTEEAGDTYICVDHILEECNDKQCKLIHSKNGLPYIWQINVSDRWISLNESEEIEKKFANNEKRFELAYTPYNESTLSIEICFGRDIEARMIIPSSDNDVEVPKARRLSTKSYIDPATLSCYRNEVDTNKFFTQWRWYWKDDYRQWNLFEPDALQYTLEVKFLAEQRSLNCWRMNYRHKYIIDFKDMKQINIDTNKIRAISRRPIFVSQENAKGKQFPVCLSAAPLVETPLPDRWVPWDLAHNFELVTIEKNSEIYTLVSDSFFRTLSRTELEIDTIFRMQNHNLWGLYCNRKNSMLANLKRLGKEEHIHQRYLFHGTDSFDAVRGISINNFDMRVSGKNATRLGDGAYFARDAKYSHAYTGIGHERFMFMATVLVGDYTLGYRSYRRPPTKPRSDHELYDSCVNTLDDPSIFIMFDKNQYYPEYLIQYHKMNKGTVAITTNYVADNSHGSVGGQSPATQNHGAVDSVTNSALRSASALTTETNDPARPLQMYLDRYRHSGMSAGAPSRTLSKNTTDTREAYPRT